MYNTNQVLVSSFHDVDNFEDRLKLFSTLYESRIISASREDSFIECLNCEPGYYRGVLSLKADPLKLRNMKCPLCNSQLVFFVTYDLNKSLYEVVKSKDGLIHHALLNRLASRNIKANANKYFLDDIEIDCSFQLNGKLYVVQCKMYKQLTTEEKLRKKFKQHYAKLVNDIIRIQTHYKKTTKSIVPVLLVNINKPVLLKDILEEIQKKNEHHLYHDGLITTLDKFLPLQ